MGWRPLCKISTAELTSDTTAALNKLGQGTDADVLDNMGGAAMVPLATNARSMLKGETFPKEAKQNIIQNGAVAPSDAG